MTDVNQEIFNDIGTLIKKRIKRFEVRYKNKSKMQRFIGFLLSLFNKYYMTSVTTTLYPIVWFPSQKFVERQYINVWKTLCHEYVHLLDRKREGWWFNFKYAFPQILAVLSFLSLLSLLSIWFSNFWLLSLLALLFLVFLAPMPSAGRRNAEMRGYQMSMAVNYWRYGSITKYTRAWVTSQFLGWSYYRMWSYEDDIVALLNDAQASIKSGSVKVGPAGRPFQDVYDLLNERGLVRPGL